MDGWITSHIHHVQFWRKRSSTVMSTLFSRQSSHLSLFLSSSALSLATRLLLLLLTPQPQPPFETAEEAARAYDEAAILMSGRNAKTNFPVPRSANGELAPAAARDARGGGGGGSSSTAGGNLSQILSAKLRKCCKTPSPSLTCLRLDPEKSHIGVWQKRAGARADSGWVMTVELNKEAAAASAASSDEPMPSDSPATTTTTSTTDSPPAMDDEERIALQMIEELLSRSSPASPLSHGMLQGGEAGSLVI